MTVFSVCCVFTCCLVALPVLCSMALVLTGWCLSRPCICVLSRLTGLPIGLGHIKQRLSLRLLCYIMTWQWRNMGGIASLLLCHYCCGGMLILPFPNCVWAFNVILLPPWGSALQQQSDIVSLSLLNWALHGCRRSREVQQYFCIVCNSLKQLRNPSCRCSRNFWRASLQKLSFCRANGQFVGEVGSK
jgi:hypothetical protein